MDESLHNMEISLFVFSRGPNLLELPAPVLPQQGIDVDVKITFYYDMQSMEVMDIHSKELPKNVDPITIKYQFAMADGSVVTTEPIPCAYLESKSRLLPLVPNG